jgi:hypothetical protein
MRSTTAMRSPRRRRCPSTATSSPLHHDHTYRHPTLPLNARASHARGLRHAPPPACAALAGAVRSWAARTPRHIQPGPALNSPGTRPAVSPRSQAGPTPPVAHRWRRARRLLACRTRAPIPRRLPEQRGVRLPDISTLLHAAFASQDRDALDARESPDSPLPETPAVFHSPRA